MLDLTRASMVSHGSVYDNNADFIWRNVAWISLHVLSAVRTKVSDGDSYQMILLMKYCFLSLHMNSMRTQKSIFAFSIIFDTENDTDNWNPSPWAPFTNVVKL